MKRSYIKNIFRTVRSTLSRFLAIFAIVALGVGFLAGLLASPDDMRISADEYCDEVDLYDLHVVSTLGLTEDDLFAVRQIEGVQNVLPVYDADLIYLSEEGDSHTTRVHTLPQDETVMNSVLLREGRMPERPGECVVTLTKSILEQKEWIGKTLTLEQDEDDEQEGVPATLTVVGTVKTAAYLSMEQEYTTVGDGSIGLIAYTPAESFNLDYYTGFFLTLSGAKELNSFSDAYDDLVAAATDRLEELGEVRTPIRYREIIDDANKELADARQEYEDAKRDAEQELADAKNELDDAEQEIKDNEQKLIDGKKELDDGRAELAENRRKAEAELADAQREIDSGYAQIRDYQAQLDAGKAQLDAAQAQLDEGYRELKGNETALAAAKVQLDELEALLAGILEQGGDPAQVQAALEQGKAEYEQGMAIYTAAKSQLDASQAVLDAQKAPFLQQQAALDAQRAELDRAAATLADSRAEAYAQLDEAEEQLNDAQREYDDGVKKLEDGKKELADGKREYEDAKEDADRELADAEEKLNDAEEEIAEISEGEWYVFTREDNAGYASYTSNAEKIGAIATVFPAFFFLVAALVALTTMTRMVEEERGQIGTMKALGYSSAQIAAKYLIYAMLASLFGSVVGLLIGMRLFPTIIINAYNILYDIPKAITPFIPFYALGASVTAVLCTVLATLSACWATLREAPARLMLPKAPKAGKRVFLEYITPLWSRLKFTQKVTARNLIRYKKRFFMTVLGIAGCTALLVTGFGVKDSVSHIVSLQYEELSQYQLMVILKDADALQSAEIREILHDENRIAGSLPVLQDEGKIVPKAGNPKDTITIFVPEETAALPDYFNFRHRADQSPIAFDEDSVIITEKLSERHGLKIGDQITVRNQDEVEASFTVTDICENYVGHTVYLPPAAYEAAFGAAAEPNMLLCKLPETELDEKALSTELLDCPDIAALRFTNELSESFENSIKSLDAIILVLIISAGALAFVVLYNLTNINISERIKEIATIKVLGFYDGEVSAYIYRENIILTLFGTAAGLVLGVFLHQFVIHTAEIDLVMFGRSVFPLSFVWSALLTVLFSLLVNLVMHRKLKKISMVESMKAPE